MAGGVGERIAKLKHLFTGAIWDVDTADWPRAGAVAFDLLRSGVAVVRDLADGQLSMRAMSLVYTTLLSLVPLLVISFSVLKGFGVHNQVEPLLLNLLTSLGDKGVEITDRIIEFVENIQAGVLGSLGLGLLVFTVISLMQKIERAFNFTWHVAQHRSLAQRFSGYLSVIVIGPLLVFSSLGITASIMSTSVVEAVAVVETVGFFLELLGTIVPYVLIIVAFTFVYIFMPNTKVELGSAIVGAMVAGILWKTMGWIFASFVVSSAKYTAIYSAFSTLVVLLLWLYLSWLILLAGASVAFYHQHPEYRTLERGNLRLSNRVREKLSLLVIRLVGENYYGGRPPWSAADIAQQLRIPVAAMDSVIADLEGAGLIAPSADDPPAFLPARPLEEVDAETVLKAVRQAEEKGKLAFERLPESPVADRLIGDRDKAVSAALKGRHLKDLALADPPPEDSSPLPVTAARRRKA